MPIENAARLAALAPGGRLDPRDDSVGEAFLDLRDDRAEVAKSKLVAVARAFGPGLFLQEGLRLLVATGELPPNTAARALAKSVGGVDGASRLGLMRGEDVLDRLEEWMLAGCELRLEESGQPLRDDGRMPLAAWAAPASAAVADALRSEAKVLMGRFLSPDTFADEGGPDTGEDCRIELWFSTGFRVAAPITGGADSTIVDSIGERGGGRCHASIEGPSETAILRLEAPGLAELHEGAVAAELLLGPGRLVRPLTEMIEPILERRHSSVPAELVEFGHETRSVEDWMD